MPEEQSFVPNATNLNRQLRGMLVRLFYSYQASVRIVYLEVTSEDLLERNRSRFAKIPEKVLYRMKYRLDVPKITEAQ
jgi:predicted kinase